MSDLPSSKERLAELIEDRQRFVTFLEVGDGDPDLADALNMARDMVAALKQLQSAHEPPAAPYRVEPTRCNCHPETCCCPDYTIWKGDIPIARGSDERLLREFVLTENARASQPPCVQRCLPVGQCKQIQSAKPANDGESTLDITCPECGHQFFARAAEPALEIVAEVHSDTLRWLVDDDHPVRSCGHAYLWSRPTKEGGQ